MNHSKLERIEVAAGIICRNGLFLATQRPDDRPLAGFWELPGGKLEGRETPAEALDRELAEELGINIREYQHFGEVEHTYMERGFTAHIHFFLVTSFEGEPYANENQNMRWLSPCHVFELDFLPADTQILNRLCESGFDLALKKV